MMTDRPICWLRMPSAWRCGQSRRSGFQLKRKSGSDRIDRAAAELRQGVSSVRRRIGGQYGLRQSKRKPHGLILITSNLSRPLRVAERSLGKLDALGIAGKTIVIVATDNGAEKSSWPDGGTSPFHGEKNDHNADWSSCDLFSSHLKSYQQPQQCCAVPSGRRVLRHLLTAWRR
jgi:hypothetical protein